MNKLIYMIINYNDSDTVIKLVNQIKNYKSIDEILIVDNKSSDDSVKVLTDLKSKKLTVIVNKSNKGYGSGINFGTKYILDKYTDANIVVSNADIIVSNEEELIELSNGLNKKNVGIVAPTVIQHGEICRPWKIPSSFQEILENIIYFGEKMSNNKLYKEDYLLGKTSDVEVVSGCVFLIKASTLKNVGFYDENVFLYYEEDIMAVKLKKEKLKTTIYNKIQFIHNHSVSIDKSVKKLKKYNILKASQRYFEKNYNKINFLELFFLDVTRWVTYIILSVFYKIIDLVK